MERPIGDIFDYEGTTLEVVKDDNEVVCSDCFFYQIYCSDDARELRGECCRDDRESEIPIHFVKIGDIFKFLK